MRITHNISSMVTQGSLFKIHRETTKSLEKLSTGLRINRASDDAAGLGVSENLRTQVKGIGQAIKNTEDFISLLQIAEGALNEMSDIMQRMRELVVQAKNDTYTQTERNYMGTEFEALGNELDRIANTTNYNGMKLFATGWDSEPATDPKVADDATSIWDTGSDGVFGANDNGAATHFNFMAGQNYTSTDGSAFNSAYQSYDKTAENMITIQLGQMDLQGLFNRNQNTGAMGGQLSSVWNLMRGYSNNNMFALGGGAQQTQFGTLQNKLNTMLELIDGETPTGVSGTPAWNNGTNYTGLDRINRMRSSIGSTINRLEHNVNNLMEQEASQQAAESLIRDNDFAKETANLAKNQILSQSATGMLAQANMNSQSVLQLLG